MPRTSHPAAGPAVIHCNIDHVVYTNHESFMVLSIRLEPTGESSYAVGNFRDLKPGTRLKLKGAWRKNPRYGLEFKTDEYEELPPVSAGDVERYLTGHCKGIGPKLARKIVQTLGTDLIHILDTEPEKLLSVEGIGQSKYASIMNSWTENRSRSHLLYFFSTLHIGPGTTSKILLKYGKMTEKVIRDNPYQLARDIHGIGFATADRIAEKLGIPPASPFRIQAGLLNMLEKAEDEGHCCLPRTLLIEQTSRLLDLGSDEIEPVVMELTVSGGCVERTGPDGQPMVFRRLMDRLEDDLADQLLRLCRAKVPPAGRDPHQESLQFERECGIRLDAAQLEAARTAAVSPLMVLTGGPGTGKTTILRLILDILKGSTVKLAAPTGRAAQRMHESTGRYASTIHRLLDFDPRSGTCRYNSSRRLNADAVVIDESSMLDLPLATALLRAIPDSCRLILVGDADQLPSVGPGQVLHNIIESECAQVIRLKTIYRQSAASRITSNAHRIIQGCMPYLESSEKMSDFYFLPRSEPEAILKTICSLPARIASHLGVDPVDDIQVLSPMYRGVVGIERLNETLRQILNPRGAQIQVGKQVFRQGDKVMQTRNNYDLEVFNGDIGKILTVVKTDPAVQIQFADKQVTYTAEQLDQITPAFACSIHKSQGSEYAAVIIPLHTQHYLMLRRNLLYTAVTRGKRMVVIVGSKKALGIAVHRFQLDQRHTLLIQRIRKRLSSDI